MLCYSKKMPKKLERYLKEKLRGINLIEVADIFLFGSAVKGKESPRDIDLCVIFRKKVREEVIKDIENKLNGLNIHISSLTTDSFFRKPHHLITTVLVEGVSILTEKPFIQNFGFSSMVLYSYNLSKLKQSEKVKFVYLLKGREAGRNERGIVRKLEGEWVADSCFIVPIQKDSEMMIIFKKWAIPHKRKEMLIH